MQLYTFFLTIEKMYKNLTKPSAGKRKTVKIRTPS
ncbi:hypothetical protein EZS27_022974 [termite gut metagenome]|uniref:Uncharacterized protein n=1 Tax=termite gut metagenome TaxID=433724 RepID=A0A5J4R3D8_9ZZZZ